MFIMDRMDISIKYSPLFVSCCAILTLGLGVLSVYTKARENEPEREINQNKTTGIDEGSGEKKEEEEQQRRPTDENVIMRVH